MLLLSMYYVGATTVRLRPLFDFLFHQQGAADVVRPIELHKATLGTKIELDIRRGCE